MIFINELPIKTLEELPMEETYFKAPRSIDSVIKDTIREYYKKYKNSEYFSSREEYRRMLDWIKWANCHDELEDELL